jgi:hypothetical protein
VNGQPRQFTLEDIAASTAYRIALYGAGGIGKTSLACLASRQLGRVGFIDLDDSLGVIKRTLPDDVKVKRVAGIEDWQGIRDAVNDHDLWQGCGGLVIDSITRAEEYAGAWTIKNVAHEKGHSVTRLEDYGFGKGIEHVYETFLALFGDLDQHIRKGRSVILICHETTSTVPNPVGEDFLRWEPRLQHPKSGKSSIRAKLKEWTDQLAFIGYDMVVQDGVARGSGSRAIYNSERPWCQAKGRLTQDQVVYHDGDDAFWKLIYSEKGE